MVVFHVFISDVCIHFYPKITYVHNIDMLHKCMSITYIVRIQIAFLILSRLVCDFPQQTNFAFAVKCTWAESVAVPTTPTFTRLDEMSNGECGR